MAEVKVVKKKDISEISKPVENKEEYVLFSKRELADIKRRFNAFATAVQEKFDRIENADIENVS